MKIRDKILNKKMLTKKEVELLCYEEYEEEKENIEYEERIETRHKISYYRNIEVILKIDEKYFSIKYNSTMLSGEEDQFTEQIAEELERKETETEEIYYIKKQKENE